MIEMKRIHGGFSSLALACVVLLARPTARSTEDDRLFGPQKIISPVAVGAVSVHAADVDGDADLDILSASVIDRTIAWYENTDGLGCFGPKQIISKEVPMAREVYPADIDGDGDIDVLSASWGNDTIAWYENTDGLGSFGPQRIITTDADGAWSVHASDLDDDGDQDVLSASFLDGKVAWYENTEGIGVFGPQQVISNQADAARAVRTADVDGDADLDVISASFANAKIAWYENLDGRASFGSQQLITKGTNGAFSAHPSDLDGDGDIDVIAAYFTLDKVAWYENVDGLGTFGPERIITTEADGVLSIHAVDLDLDGDVDVLSASTVENTVAWYENIDGLGMFGPPRIITTLTIGVRSVHAADLDGDGDADVISASSADDKLAWYENLTQSPGPARPKLGDGDLGGHPGSPPPAQPAGGTSGGVLLSVLGPGGDPLARDSLVITLDGAQPGAVVTIVLGDPARRQSLRGPDVVISGLRVNDAGALRITGTWPPGIPLGSPLSVEVWVGDPLTGGMMIARTSRATHAPDRP